MVLSLDPELSTELHQATVPTRFEWPKQSLSLICLTASQIWSEPFSVPIAISGLEGAQASEVTVSW
jgi:hypothetical protein